MLNLICVNCLLKTNGVYFVFDEIQTIWNYQVTILIPNNNYPNPYKKTGIVSDSLYYYSAPF